MLTSSYDPLLVLISILVAVLTSYTALQLASAVFNTSGTAARKWLGCGSVAMGVGIWAMHFIGMLAFSLPIELSYQASATVLSLGLAILAAAVALGIVCRPALATRHFFWGGLVMGAGIAAMHYTGMAAINMHPANQLRPHMARRLPGHRSTCLNLGAVCSFSSKAAFGACLDAAFCRIHFSRLWHSGNALHRNGKRTFPHGKL